ncbi:MAG: DUF1549 domain-containing protein [Bryobacteraceae bacterium]
MRFSLFALLIAAPCFGAPSDALAIVKSKCESCHNPKNALGKLDLTTREAALRGGVRGPALVPGKSAQSLLYQLASHQLEPAMPMGGERLSPAALQSLADWIDAGAAWSGESGDAVFTKVVKPLLEEKCTGCHFKGSGRKSGLDLTSREALLQGGDHGAGIVPGDPDASLLIRRLRHEKKPGMPFDGPQLEPAVIASVAEWVRLGAPFASALRQPDLSKVQKRIEHWAWKKPVQSPIPAGQHPVDALLALEWSKRGLKPSPQADKRTLLRRLYLDLTGLPPTLEESRAFVADNSPGAYERVVDQLLESKRYGERWGRHWMDVWRYSDWYGRRILDDQRFSHRHVWRWRDWIVEAMNQDKPYDQMLREMLAGDEIAPNDPNVLRATGYLVRSFHRFNRNVWLQDTIEHIGAGMLGVTVKCARCHDHKYDPLAQEEYYRLRAFFEPYDVRLDRMPGDPDTHDNGLARVFDANPRKGGIEPYFPPIYKDTFRLIRGDETNPDKTPLTPGVPSTIGGTVPEIKPVRLGTEAYIPDLKPHVRTDLIRTAEGAVKNAETALATARRIAEQARADASPEWKAGEKPKETVSYVNDISKIFTLRCRACHGGFGATVAKSGLSLASVDTALRGGWKHGPAIIPGKPAESPLIQYVKGELTPRMPQGGDPLAREDIDKLERWIAEMAAQDPKEVLRQAEDRLALATKHLETVKAALPSLQARLDAEAAKYAKPAAANLSELEKKAAEAERRYATAQAQEAMLEAQQMLAQNGKSAAAKRKLEQAAKALDQGLEKYTPLFEVNPEISTGRRTAFAQWITSKENPLTARVAVNHMWLRHFGKPIVPTPANFGRNGVPPLNQPLLDWLAVELMKYDWSTKKLHRLLVTSKAYRMISSGAEISDANTKIDPDNKYLWRMNSHRMEAEAVRDSVLYMSGLLDERIGGADVEEVEGLKSRRRSLYMRHSPENQVEFLRLFDQPNPTECYMRTESIIPQQALAASNSTLSLEAARTLGRKLADRWLADDEFIRNSFELLTGQPPSKEEIAESRKFLAEQTALLREPARLTKFAEKQEASVAPSADPKTRAREGFIHALLNHNEFLTVR